MLPELFFLTFWSDLFVQKRHHVLAADGAELAVFGIGSQRLCQLQKLLGGRAENFPAYT